MYWDAVQCDSALQSFYATEIEANHTKNNKRYCFFTCHCFIPFFFFDVFVRWEATKETKQEKNEKRNSLMKAAIYKNLAAIKTGRKVEEFDTFLSKLEQINGVLSEDNFLLAKAKFWSLVKWEPANGFTEDEQEMMRQEWDDVLETHFGPYRQNSNDLVATVVDRIMDDKRIEQEQRCDANRLEQVKKEAVVIQALMVAAKQNKKQ